MKKLFSVLLLLCIVLSTFTSCGVATPNNPKKPKNIPEFNTNICDLYSDEYIQVAENDDLILYYNEGSTDIKLKVKDSGYEWTSEYTNGDYVSRGEVFNITYYSTSSGVHEWDSIANCLERGQFRMTQIENGIKVDYGIGFINFQIEHPEAISNTRFEEFKNKMSIEDQGLLMSSYKAINFYDDAFKGLPKEAQDEAKLNYPKALNDDKEIWWYKNPTDDQGALALNKAFKSAGYTEDDLEHDNDGLTLTLSERPEFAMSVYYTLDGKSLSVRVPEEEIYCSEDYLLESIEILPYFTQIAGGLDGYFMLPDGSGSIMNFNNDKANFRTEKIYIPFYGVEQGKTITYKTTDIEQAILPIYGTYVNDNGAKTYVDEWAFEKPKKKKPTGKNAVLTIVEEGESFAGITAYSAKKELSAEECNFAFLDFRVNEKTEIATFSNWDEGETYGIHQFERYRGDIKFSYHFLTGEETDYNAMADVYSDYLYGGQEVNVEPKDYYSTIEMIGLINATGNFLGVSYDTKETLTTFKDVEEIAKDLKANGMNNMNIKLSGWFNGGYEHGFADDIDIESDMGGEEDFRNLITSLKKEDINLYADVDIQNVYRNEESVDSDDAAYKINRKSLMLSDFDFVRFTETAAFAKKALNFEALSENFNGFIKDYSEYDNKFVSFRNIGNELFGNYYEGDAFMERQETLNNIVGLIKGIKKDGYSIMGSVGQAPIAKYLDVVNDMPIKSTGLDKTDYSIPLTSMVFSGHLDYTNEALNLSGSDRVDLLHLIEAGAGANFKLTATTYEDLAETDYQNLFSTEYNKIKKPIFEAYNYLAKAQKDTYGVAIKSHSVIADGVVCVTYENGVSTYVNYTNKDYKVNRSLTVKAMDYETSKEGE